MDPVQSRIRSDMTMRCNEYMTSLSAEELEHSFAFRKPIEYNICRPLERHLRRNAAGSLLSRLRSILISGQRSAMSRNSLAALYLKMI